MIEININNQTRVILTHTGADCYNLYWNRLKLAADLKPKAVTIGDELNLPLWELMQIFGPMIFMSMREGPFRDNKICLT